MRTPLGVTNMRSGVLLHDRAILDSMIYLETLYGKSLFYLTGIVPSVDTFRDFQEGDELSITHDPENVKNWKRATIKGWQCDREPGKTRFYLLGECRKEKMSDSQFAEYQDKRISEVIGDLLDQYGWDLSGTDSTGQFSFSQAGKQDREFLEELLPLAHREGKPLFFWFRDGYEAVLVERNQSEQTSIEISVDDPLSSLVESPIEFYHGEILPVTGYADIVRTFDPLTGRSLQASGDESGEYLTLPAGQVMKKQGKRVTDHTIKQIALSLGSRNRARDLRCVVHMQPDFTTAVNEVVGISQKTKRYSSLISRTYCIYGLQHRYEQDGDWVMTLYLESEL